MIQRYSPCIGICTTSLGDDVCRGCRRTFEEVAHWHRMSEIERDMVRQRLNRLDNED